MSWKPGQTAITWRPSWTATVTAYLPASRAGWSARITPEIRIEAGERPLALEGLEEAREVAGRRRQLGRLDLDVVEPDHRVHRECPHGEVLADDLAMDLALGRDVDEDVAADGRGAGQPPVGAEALVGSIGRLEVREPRQVIRPGGDAVLRERPDALRHLAAAADPAPAAHRIDVDTEGARRVEDRRALGEPAAATRRREDDQRFLRHDRSTLSRRGPRADD